jgi:hypothetical protein
MFEAISQVFNSIFQMISTIMKSIINKVIFLIKVGFALLSTFIKALFYKENNMNEHIQIG